MTTLHEAPDGWVMVPREPTAEMRRAGVALHQKHTGHLSEVITAVYRAMIAAAPAQPAARKQLPGDEIYRIARAVVPKYCGYTYVPEWIIPVARAIERAHGIGGGNG